MEVVAEPAVVAAEVEVVEEVAEAEADAAEVGAVEKIAEAEAGAAEVEAAEEVAEAEADSCAPGMPVGLPPAPSVDSFDGGGTPVPAIQEEDADWEEEVFGSAFDVAVEEATMMPGIHEMEPVVHEEVVNDVEPLPAEAKPMPAKRRRVAS